MQTKAEQRIDDSSSATNEQLSRKPTPASAAISDLRSQTFSQRQYGTFANASGRLDRQRMLGRIVQPKTDAPPVKTNQTGLPDQLKAGIESLSGISMDNVTVHYNSARPAHLQAHAYAQGTDIHIAPGQERHLPHEAWHVVQQAQGRVKATTQMKDGIDINADVELEREADVMGDRAAHSNASEAGLAPRIGTKETPGIPTAQLYEAKASQKKEIVREITKKWKGAISKDDKSDDAVANVARDFIEYCESHEQALFLLRKLTYDEWNTATFADKTAGELEKQLLQPAAEEEKKEDVDVLARAKKAIKDAGHDLSKFSVSDIQYVKTIFESNSDGWAAAVQSVWELLEKKRVADQRAAEIALLTPVVAGLQPASFTGNALCMAIWHGSTMSAGASGYFELPNAYSATDLHAAWTAWLGFQQAVNGANLDGFATHRIGNGTAQDKSDRADIKSRRFTHQMNFSITWKGSEQMYHVGLQGTDNPQYGT